MKNANTFQIFLIGFCVVIILVAVVLFSVVKVGSDRSKIGPVVIWGTLSKNVFDSTLHIMNQNDIKIEDVTYVQKQRETFDEELLRAIAEDRSPDLVILNEKQIVQNQNRIITIPFQSYPLRTFQQNFIDQADLLITQEGILGFPIMIDPMVMFYNRNILSDTGFARVPVTWTEMLSITPAITIKDTSFNITRSAVALGSFDNINNAKDIYLMLLLQAGNPVIVRTINPQTNQQQYASSIIDGQRTASHAATNTFTQFANPNVSIYSWNRALPNSQTMFIAGDLGFYFGYASELPEIRRLNPNLNFDIAIVPQPQNPIRRTTYGSMSIFAIPRTSKNVSGALEVVSIFTSAPTQQILAGQFNRASIRRDVLASADPSSPYQEVINRSAIMSQGVLEPDQNKMNEIVREIIEGVVSGQFEINQAISRAHERITLILNQ